MAQEYLIPDNTVDTGTVYKAKLDANSDVVQRIAAAFAPHAQSIPDMTVQIDAGYVLTALGVTELATQTSSTITAPTTNPRIDRVVIDRLSGTISIVTGVEAVTPVAPDIPSGKAPCCQVLLDDSPVTTSITASLIIDERVIINYGTTPNINTDIINEATAGAGVTIEDVLLKDADALVGDGSISSPSLSFKNETGLGIYRLSVNRLAFVVNGVIISIFDASGLELTQGIKTESGGTGEHIKELLLEIGDWNMNTNSSTSVSHSITHSKIRGIIVSIRNDAGTQLFSFPHYQPAGNSNEGFDAQSGTGIIFLARATLGKFDSTAFQNTSYNRGWIFIKYAI